MTSLAQVVKVVYVAIFGSVAAVALVAMTIYIYSLRQTNRALRQAKVTAPITVPGQKPNEKKLPPHWNLQD